jgi:hypothetical protein
MVSVSEKSVREKRRGDFINGFIVMVVATMMRLMFGPQKEFRNENQ